MDIGALKKIVAANIAALRTANRMTQLELGEKLNYSDKAISRWERGDAVPDAGVLLQMSRLFGVTGGTICCMSMQQIVAPKTCPLGTVTTRPSP